MPSGLGRGLSSLIPQKAKKVTSVKGDMVVDIASDDERGRVLSVSPEAIRSNPMQPRRDFNETQLRELADSIEEYGIIQPLIVTTKDGGYELIAGERRLRAAKMVGLKEVPVIVRAVDEQRKLELALIENIQREDLNPIETAIAYRKLLDEFNISQEELARRIGKSRPAITNGLRLLNLPEKIQEALIKGIIPEAHAIVIAGLDSEEKQMILFKKVAGGLSLVKTFEEGRRMGGTKSARIKIDHRDKDREETFKTFFGAKTEIKRKNRGGQIIITFFNDEELENILKKIIEE